MLKITEAPTMSEYMEVLNTSTEVFMDLVRLNKACREVCFAADDLRAQMSLVLWIESAGMFNTAAPSCIIEFLQRLGIDMEKRFANKSTGNISFDIKRVVEPLISSGVEVELLSLYKEHQSYTSYANSLRKLVDARKVPKTTISGRHIIQFPTTVVERSNLRVYYKNIAVVSIPKKYSNMITGPTDSHFIAWCDYPQADWRFAYNLFIRDEKNEQIMRQCTDAYEGLARIVERDNFDLATFKENRKVYKTHSLKVFYHSRDNTAIPSAIREYFMSCPKYKKLVYDCGLLYKFKLPIPCKSYFGYEQMIPEKHYEDEFISKVTNTIVQTMTSEVVNSTVMGILQKFWALGYTKSDINVYYVRHDEPLFMFTEKILKDAWIFRECSEIYIPGFTPIHLDFHFGQYYQEEDKNLTARIEEAMQEGAGCISEYGAGCMEDYNPLPTVESCYLQFFVVDDKCHVLCYDYRTARRYRWVGPVEEMLEQQMIRALEEELLAKLGSPSYLLVRTHGLEFLDYIDDEKTMMKVVNKYDVNVAVACLEDFVE